MSRPEDLIQDEIEHPEQTQQLQQSYPVSQADQHSLQHIRARLLAQRSASVPRAARREEKPTEPLRVQFHESLERPLAGQFFPPNIPQSSKPKNKAMSTWRLVALVAVLCMVVLSGTWYALTHVHLQDVLSSTGHPISPRLTPTSVAGQKSACIDLPDLKMTSATTGWAGCAQGVFTVARTTDGGKTWQSFDFHGQPAGLIGHFFLNDQAAWVTMGSMTDPHTNITVMRTIDGGRHWTTLHMPPGVENMTFLDQQHGWAWARGPLADVQATLALYKTVDGGATWIKLGMMSTTSTPGDLTHGALPLGDSLDLTFLTPQRGWAIVYLSQVAERAFLYQTQDGGKTWQLQQLPQPATGLIPGIHTTLPGNNSQSGAFVSMGAPTFFTSQYGLVSIVSQARSQRAREIYLYETSDGGKTWSPLGKNIEGTASSRAFILDTTHLLLVDAKTITNYMLVQGQWKAQDTSRVAGVMSLSFIDGQHGWVSASQQSGKQLIRTLYTTSDGGKSWRKIMQSITTISSTPPQGG